MLSALLPLSSIPTAELFETTSKGPAGLVVPMPTFPEESIRIFSEPLTS